MKFKSKDFKNNSFILYDLDDNVICYLEDWEELHNKYLQNYRLSDLVNKFNNIYKSNIINIEINNKKLRLATFC